MDETLEHQLHLTAALVEQRVAAGDDAAAVRSVDHAVRVPRKQADAFCAAAERAGFTVRDRKRGLLRTTVELDRDDAVDAGAAAAFTREVVGLATAHGGDYDGWGALLVPVDREPAAARADEVPLAEVDVTAETTRLRQVHARRLADAGCPADVAARLTDDLSLWTSPGEGGWGLEVGPYSTTVMVPYSPSFADELVLEAADDRVDENRRRRKPWWTPTA